MRTILSNVFFVLALLFYSCGGTQEKMVNEKLIDEAENEWISLFDGKTFQGWSKYGGGEVGAAWKIQDGAIYLDALNKEGWQTGDGGDIITNEEFENFDETAPELSVEEQSNIDQLFTCASLGAQILKQNLGYYLEDCKEVDQEKLKVLDEFIKYSLDQKERGNFFKDIFKSREFLQNAIEMLNTLEEDWNGKKDKSGDSEEIAV